MRLVHHATSYPTADHFHPGFGPGEYQRALRTRADNPVSLHVHIPFCPYPCFYCGGHREITRQPGPIRNYPEALEQEIALKAKLMKQPGPVIQAHFGGGSPSFLSSAQLARILEALRTHFDFAPEVEMGIEVDPRNLDANGVMALGQMGLNRLSAGVQDFYPAVQAAINHRQSYAET